MCACVCACVCVCVADVVWMLLWILQIYLLNCCLRLQRPGLSDQNIPFCNMERVLGRKVTGDHFNPNVCSLERGKIPCNKERSCQLSQGGRKLAYQERHYGWTGGGKWLAIVESDKGPLEGRRKALSCGLTLAKSSLLSTSCRTQQQEGREIRHTWARGAGNQVGCGREINSA